MDKMTRPHFQQEIEHIKVLVTASFNDLNKLKVLQHELSFRKVPKSRALKIRVDERIRQLANGDDQRSMSDPRSVRLSALDGLEPNPTMPVRVVVECANCKAPNFISSLDGIVQHLSCSACKSPYEAQFKYGVMRTTFQTKPVDYGDSSPKWMFVALALLIMLVILLK